VAKIIKFIAVFIPLRVSQRLMRDCSENNLVSGRRLLVARALPLPLSLRGSRRAGSLGNLFSRVRDCLPARPFSAPLG